MPSLFEPAQKLRFIAESMQNEINAQFCDLNVDGPRAVLLGGRVGVWCLTRSASITPMIRKPGLLIQGVVAKAAAELGLARVLGSDPAPITRFSLLQDGGGIGRIEWRLKAMTVEVPSTRAPGVGVSAQVPPHQRGDGL